MTSVPQRITPVGAPAPPPFKRRRDDAFSDEPPQQIHQQQLTSAETLLPEDPNALFYGYLCFCIMS